MVDIVYNFVHSMMLLIQQIFALGLGVIIDIFLQNDFSPSLAVFKTLLGEGISGTMRYEALRLLMMKAGLALIAILFVVRAIMAALPHVAEVKDTVPELLVRLVFSCMLMGVICYFSDTIVEYAEAFGDTFYERFSGVMNGDDELIWTDLVARLGGFNNGETETEEEGEGESEEEEDVAEDTATEEEESTRSDQEIVNMLIDDEFEDEAVNDLNVVAETLNLALEILIMLFEVLILCVVGYNIIKLCIELIRRYIVFAIMHMFMPFFPCFTISSDSERIFLQYMKMYFTQIGILIFTRSWIFFCLCFLNRVPLTIVNLFMIFALLNIGVKIEGYLKDIGFSVSNQGGALLDSVVITGAIVTRSLTGMARVAGSGMIQVGSLTGSTGMVRVGSVITGKDISPRGVVDTMERSVGGEIRRASSAPVTASMEKLVSDLANKGSLIKNAELDKAFNGLVKGQENKTQLANSLLNKNFGNLVNELKKNGMHVSGDGTYAAFKGVGVNVDGSVNGSDGMHNVQRHGYVSDVADKGGISIPFIDNAGAQKFLNIDSDSGNFHADGPVAMGFEGEQFSSNGTPTSGEMAFGYVSDEVKQAFAESGVGDMDASHLFAEETEDGGIKYSTSESGSGEDLKPLAYQSSNGNVIQALNESYAAQFEGSGSQTLSGSNDENNSNGQQFEGSGSQMLSGSNDTNNLYSRQFADAFNLPNGDFHGKFDFTYEGHKEIPSKNGGRSSFIITGKNSAGEEKQLYMQPVDNAIKHARPSNTSNGYIFSELRKKKDTKKQDRKRTNK